MGFMSNIFPFQALEPDKGISVEPEDLVLVPGEEQEVTVEFSPKNSRNSER